MNQIITYVGIKEVDVLLHEIENRLTEIVGRFQAQRMIGMYSDFNSRNIWLEIYSMGLNAKKEGDVSCPKQ